MNRRQLIWIHNGFQGSIAMAKVAMTSISQAKTASPYAQKLAAEMQAKLIELSVELKTNRQD